MAVLAPKMSEELDNTECARLSDSGPDTGFGGSEPQNQLAIDPAAATGDFLEDTLREESRADLAEKYVDIYRKQRGFRGVRSLDEEYQKIGWWKGPHSGRATMAEIHQFWIDLQLRGALFLVFKTRTEFNADALSGVANILSSMARSSLAPILKELGRPDIEDEQAETLLKAIGWMEPYDPQLVGERLVRVIERFLGANSSDVRDAASAATRVLVPEVAIALLRARQHVELDPEVQEALKFELEERGFSE